MTDCNLKYTRHENVEPIFSDLSKCVKENNCCPDCEGDNIWITIATGANYPDFEFIGSVLQDIIRDHLQFTDEVIRHARASINFVEAKLKIKNIDILDDHHFVGVHVR